MGIKDKILSTEKKGNLEILGDIASGTFVLGKRTIKAFGEIAEKNLENMIEKEKKQLEAIKKEPDKEMEILRLEERIEKHTESLQKFKMRDNKIKEDDGVENNEYLNGEFDSDEESADDEERGE